VNWSGNRRKLRQEPTALLQLTNHEILYALVAARFWPGLTPYGHDVPALFEPVAKVWFFGSGMAIALSGVLKLLNRRYGLAAFGLRAACIGTNLFMVCLAAVAGRDTGASVAGQVVGLSVLTSALVLLTLRSAGIAPQPSRT